MFLDHERPLAFAHRGGAYEAVENTLAAFDYAIGLGYRYIETDVRRSADGRCVVFHDETLVRLAGHGARIEDLTWREIAEIDVRGEKIPLLAEVLATWPETRFNIDAKHDAVVDTLIDTIESARALGRVCLGAFAPSRLRRMRHRIPEHVATVMGFDDVARLRLASWGLPLRPRAGGAVQIPVGFRGLSLDSRKLIDAAHEFGLQVHYWTINDPDEMHRLLDLGADGIMTDRPSVLKRVLESRGTWA